MVVVNREGIFVYLEDLKRALPKQDRVKESQSKTTSLKTLERKELVYKQLLGI